MKYEELLAQLTDSEPVLARATLYSALRAIVELHKPQPTTIPTDPKCSACSGLDWCDYPCETITIIEKFLQ